MERVTIGMVHKYFEHFYNCLSLNLSFNLHSLTALSEILKIIFSPTVKY